MAIIDRIKKLERNRRTVQHITAIVNGRAQSITLLDAIELARDGTATAFRDAPHGSGAMLELLNGLVKDGAAYA